MSNLDILVSKFVDSVDTREIKKENVNKLRCAFELTVKKSALKDLVTGVIVENLKQNPPEGFRKINAKQTNVAIPFSEKEITFYANKPISETQTRAEGIKDEGINEVCNKLIKKVGTQTSEPNFKLIREDEDLLIYDLEFDLFDNIEDIEFDKIELENAEFEITDEEIEKEIKRILESEKKVYETLDAGRVIKLDDLIVIDFKGTIQKRSFNGGSSDNLQLELGKGQLLQDLESEIIGMKLGEFRNILVRFPKNYQNKSLAGLNANFAVTIKKIFDNKPFDNVEEFIEDRKIESLDKLNEIVKNNLIRQNNLKIWLINKDVLLEKLNDSVKIELPELIVERELAQAKINYANKKAQEMMKKIGSSEENNEEESAAEIEKEIKELDETIRSKVKLSMILSHIANEFNIQLENQDLMMEIFNQSQNYGVPYQEILNHFQNNKNALEALKNTTLEDKILKFIITKLSLNKISLSIDEIQKRYDAIVK